MCSRFPKTKTKDKDKAKANVSETVVMTIDMHGCSRMTKDDLTKYMHRIPNTMPSLSIGLTSGVQMLVSCQDPVLTDRAHTDAIYVVYTSPQSRQDVCSGLDFGCPAQDQRYNKGQAKDCTQLQHMQPDQLCASSLTLSVAVLNK